MIRAAAMAAILLLAGCRKAPQEPLFPLDAGRQWKYRVTTSYDDSSVKTIVERLELAARGRADIGGAAAWKRTSSTGVAYWLRHDASGVYRVAVQGPLDPQARTDAAARYVLKRPYAVGTEWEAATTTYVLLRRNEFPRELRHLARYRSLPMKYRITGVEHDVETPAGRFSGCLAVEGAGEIQLYVEELFAVRGVPFITREWYCPQVGLVKLQRVERSPSRFLVGGTLTMELTDYR